jgi:hypothetical protein
LKFKKYKDIRRLTFVDFCKDEVSVEHWPQSGDYNARFYISANAVMLKPAQARKFAMAILKELDR